MTRRLFLQFTYNKRLIAMLVLSLGLALVSYWILLGHLGQWQETFSFSAIKTDLRVTRQGEVAGRTELDFSVWQTGKKLEILFPSQPNREASLYAGRLVARPRKLRLLNKSQRRLYLQSLAEQRSSGDNILAAKDLFIDLDIIDSSKSSPGPVYCSQKEGPDGILVTLYNEFLAGDEYLVLVDYELPANLFKGPDQLELVYTPVRFPQFRGGLVPSYNLSMGLDTGFIGPDYELKTGLSGKAHLPEWSQSRLTLQVDDMALDDRQIISAVFTVPTEMREVTGLPQFNRDQSNRLVGKYRQDLIRDNRFKIVLRLSFVALSWFSFCFTAYLFYRLAVKKRFEATRLAISPIELTSLSPLDLSYLYLQDQGRAYLLQDLLDLLGTNKIQQLRTVFVYKRQGRAELQGISSSSRFLLEHFYQDLAIMGQYLSAENMRASSLETVRSKELREYYRSYLQVLETRSVDQGLLDRRLQKRSRFFCFAWAVFLVVQGVAFSRLLSDPACLGVCLLAVISFILAYDQKASSKLGLAYQLRVDQWLQLLSGPGEGEGSGLVPAEDGGFFAFTLALGLGKLEEFFAKADQDKSLQDLLCRQLPGYRTAKKSSPDEDWQEFKRVWSLINQNFITATIMMTMTE